MTEIEKEMEGEEEKLEETRKQMREWRCGDVLALKKRNRKKKKKKKSRNKQFI